MEPPLEVGRGGCGSALSTVHQGRLRRHYTRRESENGTARGEGGGKAATGWPLLWTRSRRKIFLARVCVLSANNSCRNEHGSVKSVQLCARRGPLVNHGRFSPWNNS